MVLCIPFRGEKMCGSCQMSQTSGSPPLVRGKVDLDSEALLVHRITPACAGKRKAQASVCPLGWDHPRLCGEKGDRRISEVDSMGSPPLVRGKAAMQTIKGQYLRITPACARKRRQRRRYSAARRDHPRLRGEKRLNPSKIVLSQGSPPLARGKADGIQNLTAKIRITPACAGKSAIVRRTSCFARDHPRLRGEKPLY